MTENEARFWSALVLLCECVEDIELLSSDAARYPNALRELYDAARMSRKIIKNIETD